MDTLRTAYPETLFTKSNIQDSRHRMIMRSICAMLYRSGRLSTRSFSFFATRNLENQRTPPAKTVVGDFTLAGRRLARGGWWLITRPWPLLKTDLKNFFRPHFPSAAHGTTRIGLPSAILFLCAVRGRWLVCVGSFSFACLIPLIIG